MKNIRVMAYVSILNCEFESHRLPLIFFASSLFLGGTFT